MAEINLRPDLVRRLQALSEQEHRPVDDVLDSLLAHYPSLNAVAFTEAERARLLEEDRLRTYERARRYWRTMNDERQHLTDEQLREQFWLFDRDGIPRLKADQG